MDNLSHLDERGKPQMVDVGGKVPTHRTAVARALVALPLAVQQLLENGEIVAPKGAVFQTAILAGIMAAKKTGDLIPLCHPLPLENCALTIALLPDGTVEILCTATVFAKTGVEMEALTGASIAALTVYDMCKAISHEMVIKDIRLIKKTGGKRDIL